MRGKYIFLMVMAVIFIIAIPAAVLAAKGANGNANAKPPTKIEAKFKFTDDGSELKISGTAKGLTSSREYVSLIYGPGSLVRGLRSCRPNSPNTLGPIMFVGVWDVSGDGTGTLEATNITSNADGSTDHYVPLGDIGTISVRLLTRDPAVSPPPSAQSHRPNVVVACGKVTP